jgi:nucleoside-diphosphate-sugar epimerase
MGRQKGGGKRLTMALDHQRILVTGGGGFLGKAIISRLIAGGCHVRSLSRNLYEDLSNLGVEQIPGDIRDTQAVNKACDGVDVVFHTAAKAGIWGNPSDFFDINVTGTKNILAACSRAQRVRLIHTSSPSVVFNGRDMAGVNESVPYPDHYSSSYPATKARAEKLVSRAAANGLPVIILRPHLIWGPGDNHLVPRIVRRARQLRRVGDGRNLVDTVYIDNAADAHILAADRLRSHPELSGNRYFISQGEPVLLWEMVDNILKAANKEPVKGRISRRAAWIVGTLLESVYRAFKLSGEPRMTRFLSEELSTSHWFDIRAAREDLGYVPAVSTCEGLRRLSEWFVSTGFQH